MKRKKKEEGLGERGGREQKEGETYLDGKRKNRFRDKEKAINSFFASYRMQENFKI